MWLRWFHSCFQATWTIYIHCNSPNLSPQLCKNHTWTNVIRTDWLPIWSLLWNAIQSEAIVALANILRIHETPQPKPWFIAPRPKAFGWLYVEVTILATVEVWNGPMWTHRSTACYHPLERWHQKSSESLPTEFAYFPLGSWSTTYLSGLIDNIMF